MKKKRNITFKNTKKRKKLTLKKKKGGGLGSSKPLPPEEIELNTFASDIDLRLHMGSILDAYEKALNKDKFLNEFNELDIGIPSSLKTKKLTSKQKQEIRNSYNIRHQTKKS